MLHSYSADMYLLYFLEGGVTGVLLKEKLAGMYYRVQSTVLILGMDNDFAVYEMDIFIAQLCTI